MTRLPQLALIKSSGNLPSIQKRSRLLFRSLEAGVRRNLYRAASLVLIFSLLTTSTAAAPQTIVAVTTEWHASLAFWWRATNPHKLFQRWTGQESHGKPQEQQEQRNQRVARIQIYPGDVTVTIEERITFAAVAYDGDGNTIGGVDMDWSALEEGRNHQAPITPEGDFAATAPGTFRITVEGAGRRAHARVTVIDGSRRSEKGPSLGSRPISSRDLPNNQSSRNVSRQKDQKAAHASRRGNAAASSPGAGQPISALPTLPLDEWGSDNYTYADDPGNRRGDPPGAPMDNGAGSGNFQMVAPVLASSGRGLDVALGLAYNSRLWNKSGNNINFDIDRDWPAPGWSLGVGSKVVDLGLAGSMIVDPDGTRHSFKGTVTPYSTGEIDFAGHTTDGTLIDYASYRNSSGALIWAEVNMPNGSQIHYECRGPGGMFPTQIVDANGNFISITYVLNTGPRIETITDTLGRAIIFLYDSNNLLTAIKGPDLDGQTRTLVRLHYRQLTLNYSFASPLTPVVRDPSPWVIDAIYYPATSTGYWFGDTADSYSSYGMLAKVVEQRGMGFSASSETEMGTVTPGQMTRTETYNYPLTANSGLTDAPTYSSVTETWTRDGDPNNLDSATTNYQIWETFTNPAQPTFTSRKVEVTLPNGTKSIQYSYNYTSLSESDPRKVLDGTVYQDETRDSAAHFLQGSTATWEAGAYDSPRPLRIEATNELNQTTATAFTYGTQYNQVLDVRNYDYGGTALLRSTRTQYQNSANYTTSRHIFNLPLTVEVFGSDNVTRVSRTEYQYDGQALADTPGVIQHSNLFNPYAPQVLHHGTCCDWQLHSCLEYCEDYYTSDYNPVTDYRGNITQVTSYADALTPSVPMTETRRYDINGNLVLASTSCCQQMTFTYTVDTKFAYPQSQTRGSATDPYAQVTTGGTYDFNTGLPLSATDANGRTSQTTYLSQSLRPQTSSLPSGAHTDYAYDDTAMSVTTTTYLESHPTHTTIADQNVKLLNGRGQVRQEKALGANGAWDFVDTIYDNMGRVSQQSRPYRSGESPILSTVFYDALGRTTRTASPDGSVTESYYNEVDFDSSDSYSPVRPNVVSGSAAGETTLVRDAWGRERWARRDAQGRLVEVVEPNSSGGGAVANGGLLTKYVYDTLGDLIEIDSMAGTQVEQRRSFKYDSLGRLSAQKLAEVSATLDNAGIYHASGGTWSEVFTYDDRSNLISRTDARGVKTVFNYNGDPLNRLQSVSWDTSGFGDTTNPILAAATVSYQYRTKSSSSELRDITQLSSVTTSGVSTESYVYDSENRISSETLTLTSRSSYPFATNYSYDALDRVTDVQYPAEYGNGTQPRKVVHQDYDVASRLANLTVDGATNASQIVYNAASQATSLKVGASGANQITETYGYNAQTGLLDTQTVTRSAATLLNLSYEYVNGSGKRTGQLTKIHNNLNPGKDRGYAYDALGRLTQATGGEASAPNWTQTYSYDRYGNRTSVSASGYSASNLTGNPSVKEGLARNAKVQGSSFSARTSDLSVAASADQSSAAIAPPAEPHVALPTEQIAANVEVQLPDSRGGATRSMVKSHHASRALPASPAAPVDPPVFTDPDLLVSGGVVVKVAHITELRTAINSLRSQLGLAAFSWQTSAVSGSLITADPILEMRTALDQALGAPPAPGYAAGLAQGQPIKAIHIQELRNRVLAAWNGGGGSCPPGQTLLIDQFVKNFYQGALGRQPNANELQSWSSQLRQAYYQGQTQLLGAAQYLGRQLFKSSEYAARNRDDHSFVYDLYWAYLQRQPDQSGWDWWTTQAGLSNGRENVRHAFEDAGDTEFVAKLGSLCPGFAGAVPIPLDGLASLTYDAASNRITTSGFQYDAAGNQTRTVRADGSGQKFQYDAANRLIQVRDNYDYVLATYTYSDSNERLIADEGGLRTYYPCSGSMEYFESGSSTTPQWSKTYVYLGARLLSTLTPNGSGGELVQYHHPDRLGTRLVTNAQNSTYFEQVSLPFGTALDSESTGASKRRFTSYDRSSVTGLDYANNRHYDPQQGRFTQVDPAGMDAVSLGSPQTLNLYAYCTNDPINRTDPSGLGFLSFLKRIVKRIVNAVIHAAITAIFTFLQTLIVTGGNLHAALVAGAIAGGADFLKQLGWPSKGFQISPGGTPQWNPNAVAVLSGGPSGLSRAIIWNFQDPGQDVDIIRSWIWEPGSKLLALMNRIRKALCKAVPTGRVSGVQGTGGILGGPTGGVELVQNYRSGQISGFAFGGAQVGWNGGAAANVSSGFVWGLNDSNSNYSEGFSGVNGSGRVGINLQSSSGGLTSRGPRDLIPNPRKVSSASLTAGVSLIPTPTGGLTVTHYSKPLQMGKWWAQASNMNIMDASLIGANQACR